MEKVLFIGGSKHGLYIDAPLGVSYVCYVDNGKQIVEQKYNLAKFSNINESNFVYVLDGTAYES